MRVERATRKPGMLVELRRRRGRAHAVTVFAKKPLGLEGQDGEEHDVADEDAPAGAEGLGAEGLRDAEDDAADERPPDGAHAAHDDRLEGEDEAERALAGVERGADREQDAGERDDGQRDGHGQAVDVAVVDAHQLGRFLVVGGGPEGAAELGPVEEQLERGDDHDGDARTRSAGTSRPRAGP